MDSVAFRTKLILRLEVGTEDAVESEHGREGEDTDGKKTVFVDVDPPTSTPPIPRVGEPNSM